MAASRKSDIESIRDGDSPPAQFGGKEGEAGHVYHQESQDNQLALTALLRNPLMGMTQEQVLADVDNFVQEKGLTEHRDSFRKGALIARVSNIKNGFERIEMLTEEEKAFLRREETNRWDQPFALYFLCILCAGSAIVQGMDQTAVNGAQVRKMSLPLSSNYSPFSLVREVGEFSMPTPALRQIGVLL